jgi:5-methylcytosine-specific restriction endonuclease McrA
MYRRPNTSCTICQKPIYRRPAQIQSGQVYCSQICCGKSQQKPKQCPICAKSYSGAKRTCSRECANKNRQGISYTKENASNLAYRGKMIKEQVAKRCQGICERCGEKNYAILQVHHKIERYRGGTDNLENLELLCPNCHMTHHLGYSLYEIQKMV